MTSESIAKIDHDDLLAMIYFGESIAIKSIMTILQQQLTQVVIYYNRI